MDVFRSFFGKKSAVAFDEQEAKLEEFEQEDEPSTSGEDADSNDDAPEKVVLTSGDGEDDVDDALSFDGDAAFEEEEENLRVIEEKIEQEIANAKKKADDIERSNKGYHPIDREDQERLRIDRSDVKRYRKEAETWRGQCASPYYAHIDLEDESGGVKRIFVGREGISRKNAEQLVYDWRSEAGKIFANKQNLNPVLGGTEYSLLLRRGVTIHDAKLQEVSTEYDARNTSLSGDVVDPFLLSVLKERRGSYALGNIIRTIQQNQNEIMRLPIDADFLVQGCAGSGKTMILLHRLSYLVYNHPEVDFSKYAIISPSDDFSKHIDDLAGELGLSNVTKYTIDSFYTSLIRKLSFTDVYSGKVNGRVKEVAKVVVPDAIDSLEERLGMGLLKEIYSDSFVSAVWSMVDQARSDASECLESSELQDLLDGRVPVELSSCAHPYDLFLLMDKVNRVFEGDKARLQADFDAVCASIEKTKAELGKISVDEIVDNNGILASSLNSVKGLAQNLVEHEAGILKEVKDNEERIAFQETEVARIEGELERCKSQCAAADGAMRLYESEDVLGESIRAACAQQKAEHEALLEVLAADAAYEERALEPLRLGMHDAEDRLRSQCVVRSVLSKTQLAEALHEASLASDHQEHHRLTELIRCIDGLSVDSVDVPDLLEGNGVLYAHARSLLEDEVACFLEAKDDFDCAKASYDELCAERDRIAARSLQAFESKVDACVSEAIAGMKSELRVSRKTLKELHAQNQELLRTRSEQGHGSSLDELRLSAAILEAAEACAYPDLSEFVGRSDGILDTVLRAYKTVYDVYGIKAHAAGGDAQEKHDSLRARLDEDMREKAAIEKELTHYAEGGLKGRLERAAEALDIRTLRVSLDAQLASLYERSGQRYDKKTCYRHQLFAIFALCAKYYGNRRLGISCLCVDEAQDISPVEYKTVMHLLGEGVSYNLYGDVNQLTCPYRGVSNWNELDGIRNLERYVLADNYRNTRQITEYCNKEFGQEVVAVGLEGPEVVTCDVEEAVLSLDEFGTLHEGARLAVIHECDREAIRPAVEGAFGENVAWGAVEPGKVSVIDAVESKGLEFDAVMVVSDCMTVNERYIACTRALDSLWVTSIEAE